MQKKPLALAMSGVLFLGAAVAVPLAMADEVTPVVGAATVKEIAGTVVVVDKTTRLMTVKTPEGVFEVLSIPPEVKRIDAIKIGDKVTISETEAVLVDVETGRDAGAMGSIATTDVDPEPGPKPAGTIVEKLKLFGKVEQVDKASSRVTVRGPKRTVTLKVQDPAVLDRLKPGDGIIATYVRAITGKVELK